MDSTKSRAINRVLLTGHRGYIGTVLSTLLLERGYEVVGLDSDIFRACSYGPEPPAIPTIDKDVRDVRPDDLAGFDAVLHLAALSNDPLGDLDPQLTDDINHQASVRLAEMAKAAGVRRFAFSSSCSVYGASESDDVILTEESPLHPVTPYAVSKAQVEEALHGLASDEFSPVCLRNATAYGVSPRIRFDLVLNNLVAWAFCTGKVHLKSDGGSWRPLVHIEDISRAFVAVTEARREVIHDEVFNIGHSEENYRIRDLAHIVAETVPDSEVEIAAGASADQRNYRVNCAKAEELLGFVARWTVRRGAQELLEAYRTRGLSLTQFEGTRYQRLAHLRHLLAEGTLRPDLRFTAPPPPLDPEDTSAPVARRQAASTAVRATS